MVHHLRMLSSTHMHRLLQLLSTSNPAKYINAKPAFLRLLLFFTIVFVVVTLIFFPRLLFLPSPPSANNNEPAPCSPLANNNTICCDRTAYRTDVCFMRGDVRTHSTTNSIFLLSAMAAPVEERIRPYTRKWENATMSTIDELRLRTAERASPCEVRHDVPAVVFSNGGFTGHVYHEFSDGLIPLYVTSHQFNRSVVFVVVEYHDWWFSKYRDVLARLSDYPLVDFDRDKRTHCFPEAIVGLRIHGELTIDPGLMTGNRTIRDFRQVLDDAFRTRLESKNQTTSLRPKLVFISRKGSRKVENEGEVMELAGSIGFEVEVLVPESTGELARIYGTVNASDVMVGVHGAAMTHLLFMRPGSVLVQIVPLGTGWAAEEYYGKPARKLGLMYVRYEVAAGESSLHREYRKEDPVLADPESVNAKGWETTKRVYLSGQNVSLDLTRFRGTLVRAYAHAAKDKLRNLE